MGKRMMAIVEFDTESVLEEISEINELIRELDKRVSRITRKAAELRIEEASGKRSPNASE